MNEHDRATERRRTESPSATREAPLAPVAGGSRPATAELETDAPWFEDDPWAVLISAGC